MGSVTCLSLSALPRVDRLTLAVVNAVPDWHPEHATFEPFPVHAWVIRHPDGVVLVDTGIGFGNPTIDECSAPTGPANSEPATLDPRTCTMTRGTTQPAARSSVSAPWHRSPPISATILTS